MLHEIIGRLDDDKTIIEPPFSIDYGCNISLSKRCYSNFNLTILDYGLVTVGDRVLVGPNVSIFAATHETEAQSRRDNVEFAKPVIIGNDYWIGGHVVILPGVTIGDGCTIAANSTVTKDIPAWSVAVGSPAKVVKKVTPLPKSRRILCLQLRSQRGHFDVIVCRSLGNTFQAFPIINFPEEENHVVSAPTRIARPGTTSDARRLGILSSSLHFWGAFCKPGLVFPCFESQPGPCGGRLAQQRHGG